MTNPQLPLFTQRIVHEALDTAARTVDELLAEKDPTEGCIIPLLGPTRVGKTAVIERLTERSGNASSMVPMKNVVQTMPVSRLFQGMVGSSMHSKE